MKKLLPHIIYILIIVFFVVFANIKANEAEKASYEVIINSELAQKNAEDAKKQAELANIEAAKAREAKRTALKAMEELEKCQNK
ncbi:MAG: hypothetical protein JXR10_09570 [Cyclobacteriaceae bacterium]